jgi:ABC-type branched-subunit amino acid transport system permease subunit
MPYDLNYYLANLAVYFLIYCVLTLGLNVSFGMAGVLDFSFITFMAMGAYFAGVTALAPAVASEEVQYILGLNWPFPLDLLAGAVAAAALGLFVGLLAIRRLRSDYLAIVLVAVWTIAWSLVTNLTGLFNGTGGLIGVPQPLAAQANVNPNDYVFVFIPIAAIAVGILFLISYSIENSPFGRALRAVREDQDVAAAYGKRTTRLRLTAMVIGCAYAGVAGALTIEFLTAMNPNAWEIVETVIVFAALLVGGRGNVFGAILGALLVRIVIIEGTGLLPAIPGHEDLVSAIRNIAIGLVVIAVLFLRPEGVLRERKKRYFERRGNSTDQAVTEAGRG